MKCPYEHGGKKCPPGWHDIKAEGGDVEPRPLRRRSKVAAWIVLGLVAYVLLIGVLGVVTGLSEAAVR